MLRDNLTNEEREYWKKQIKSLYWSPERATCLNIKAKESIKSLDQRLKNNLQDKMQRQIPQQQTESQSVDEHQTSQS